MGLVERTLDSGLVLQEYGQDHASLERELKRRDRDLSLVGEFSETHGCIIWKVILNRPDRPWETVYVWMSERGEPYPLSSGILDGLDRLDRNTRAVHVGEDEINAARDRELAEQDVRDREALVDDWTFKHGRPVLPRSQSLRMSRDKQRARGKKV
jgi:hypothetical protein